MDTTHDPSAGPGDSSAELLASLAAADPADAPAIAEELAGALSHELDGPSEAERPR